MVCRLQTPELTNHIQVQSLAAQPGPCQVPGFCNLHTVLCVNSATGQRYVDENNVLQPPIWDAEASGKNLIDWTNKLYKGTGIQ